MAPTLRVAAVALNQTPLDWAGNGRRLREALEAVREGGADLVCFPELCISGYGAEDAFLWPDTAERSFRLLEELLPTTRGLVVSFGLPIPWKGSVYNAAALVVDGAIVGLAAKRHLAGDGLHYEPRWFRPWPAGMVDRVERGGRSYPIGDLVFEVGGVRIGFEICEDAWVPERPGRELAATEVDVILNPSASHFAFGKHERRRQLVLEGARGFGAAYVYVNLLGNEAGRAIYDGDALIATQGEIRAAGRRFSFAPRCATWASISVEEQRAWRAASGDVSLGDDASKSVPLGVAVQGTSRGDGARARSVLVTEHTWRSSGEAVEAPRGAVAQGAAFETSVEKEEAFARTIALGLFDYLRKSRSRGFVVSLSGGADSAAVVVLVRYLVRLGVEELGLAGFVDALGFVPSDERPATELEIVRRLLVTAYQSTDNSSPITRRAARELAEALGAEHHEWDVQELARGYVSRIEAALARPLEWERDDLALQNIQARARAPSVWLLANARSMLLLSTSNRSEAAVGYATMDGDTAGGLSPLAGIDKAYLRRWLRHVEEHGLPAWEPLSALRLVNAQTPTAELRPSERAQTDESDLMPYEVLDVAERATLVARRAPQEVLEILVERFPEYSRAELLLWTKRFYRLFARNQWKRERYAPSFHVDDANLDPKTWCRFPILSGGFESELAELE